MRSPMMIQCETIIAKGWNMRSVCVNATDLELAQHLAKHGE